MAFRCLCLLAENIYHINTAGWIMLIVSNTFVLILTLYCIIKVMSLPAHSVDDDLHGFTGIDTGDTVDPD